MDRAIDRVVVCVIYPRMYNVNVCVYMLYMCEHVGHLMPLAPTWTRLISVGITVTHLDSLGSMSSHVICIGRI